MVANIGEVPRAYVVLRGELSKDLVKRIVESETATEKINHYVNTHVAEYKRLEGGIEFVDEIPKAASGKILRKDLRTLYIQSNKKAKGFKSLIK